MHQRVYKMLLFAKSLNKKVKFTPVPRKDCKEKD